MIQADAGLDGRRRQRPAVVEFPELERFAQPLQKAPAATFHRYVV